MAATPPSLVVQQRFGTMDWSFSGPYTVGRSGTPLFEPRKHHWYPATFIPEIPHSLIQVCSHPGATVYDPFAGIGTTAIQALITGRNAICGETNKIALELSRSYVDLLANDIPDSVISSFLDQVVDCSEDRVPTEFDYSTLEPWFNSDTWKELLRLFSLERELGRSPLKSAVRICLSATLKAVCAQDRGWGCIADNMLPNLDQRKQYRPALQRFVRNLNVLQKDLRRLGGRRAAQLAFESSHDSPTATILEQDVRTGLSVPDASVDLVITSPPYPNMTDYATSQRLTYYWLGHDLGASVATEIGARRKRFSKQALKGYSSDMQLAIGNILRSLKHGGYIALILPQFDPQIKSEEARAHVLSSLRASVLTYGCSHVVSGNRILPLRRRHHNQGWLSLTRETIDIYRRDVD